MTVDKILAVFTKTVTKLTQLAQKRRNAAEGKQDEAAALVVEAADDLAEAQRAERIADKLIKLLSDD